jgi:alkyldihydroxyacetonephosphate synthase
VVRAISQAGLYPANCRLVDAAETGFTEAGDGKHDLLVLTFELANQPLEPRMKRALGHRSASSAAHRFA